MHLVTCLHKGLQNEFRLIARFTNLFPFVAGWYFDRSKAFRVAGPLEGSRVAMAHPGGS